MRAPVSMMRRPLGCCWQAAPQPVTRAFATTAAAAAPTRFQVIPTKGGGIRTAFAVYSAPPKTTPSPSPPPPPPAQPSTPSPTSSQPPPSPDPASTHKVDVLRAYDRQQIARMDPSGARTLLFSRKNPDSAKPGDVLMVTPSKPGAEAFAGVCLAIRRSGIETAILLRGQLAKTGIEMWFKIYSRAVAAIDIIERRTRRARRAKLTYMRQPRFDRGSVDEVVKNWRRSRNVMHTSSGGGGATKTTGPKGKR